MHSQLFDPHPASRLIARHRELVYPFSTDFFRIRLSIAEGTFCPTLTNTTPFFIERLIEAIHDGPVVDVFAGSGAIGLQFAKAGLETVLVEQSEHACSDALRNAQLNGCAEHVSIVNVGVGCRSLEFPSGYFRHAIANPPLLPGHPNSALEAALFDPQYSGTLAFLDLLPSLLGVGGRGWLLLSDVFERYGLLVDKIAAARGLSVCSATSKNVGYETYTVFELSHVR